MAPPESLVLAAVGACLVVSGLAVKKALRRKGSPDQPPRLLLKDAQQAGQGHIFDNWVQLNQHQRESLVHEAQSLDFRHIQQVYETSKNPKTQEPIRPLSDAEVSPAVEYRSQQCILKQRKGFQLLAEGKMALLCLAGGQGTRSGSPLPKGCIDMGLPSHKSLFCLQAERLRRLEQLAAHVHWGNDEDIRGGGIKWYIMTSPATNAAIRDHFEENEYFGLSSQQVVFFTQDTLPCLTEEGKIIMASKASIAMAPNGNGGVYTSLKRQGILDDMEAQGIQYVDCYCADNALARVGDPTFLGHCALSNADCGARVVKKAYPEERVGVFARRGDAISVVEYSELPPDEAESVNAETLELNYGWANISAFAFRLDFLQRAAQRLEREDIYHIARKSIPSKDGMVQGWKLELFIFDTLPWASNLVLMEVKRAEHFAPVKNAPGSKSDSPETARAAVLALHRSWIVAAGGKPICEEGPELSSLASYQGEGLVNLLQGRTLTNSYDDILQGDVSREAFPARMQEELRQSQELSPARTLSLRRLSSLFSGLSPAKRSPGK